MRKEVVWAIVAGIIFGLVVAFGVYRININILKNKKVVVTQESPSPSPVTPLEFKLVIDKPSMNDVVTTDTINVSGLTKGGLWVTVSDEDNDYTIQSDSTGSFIQEVKLIPGVNQIKVTAFDLNGNQNAANVLVIYSSSFQLRTSPSPSSNENASDSSDIRQRVKQDLVNTINRPRSFIGTVTDITDSTIEIKTSSSEIQQVSINNTTDVVSDITITKTVKTSDIAIGDFIITMGYIETNSVLGAQRILITSPIEESKITVKLGSLTDIDKKTAITKAAKAKLAKVKDEDRIIFVATIDSKGNSTIRSIFVI